MPDRMIDRIRARRQAGGQAEDAGVVDDMPDTKEKAPVAEEGPGLLDTVADVGKGFAKQAGSTAVDLGNIVHSIPGLGKMTDYLAKVIGPAGTDPSTAFSGASEALKPTNGAQQVGSTAEQIGEFLVPVGPAKMETGMAAFNGMKRLGLSTAKNPKLFAAGMTAGRAAGEAASAAGVSALHGDKDPEVPGAVAGGARVAGEGAAALTPLLNTEWGRRLGPYLAGILTAKLLPEMGLGAGLGAFGLSRLGAAQMLKNPAIIPAIQRTIVNGASVAGRAGAATTSIARRKVPGDEP